MPTGAMKGAAGKALGVVVAVPCAGFCVENTRTALQIEVRTYSCNTAIHQTTSRYACALQQIIRQDDAACTPNSVKLTIACIHAMNWAAKAGGMPAAGRPKGAAAAA